MLLEEDNLRWKQRTKQRWLQDGDRNTNYFYACANKRRMINVIKTIEIKDESVTNSIEEIARMFLNQDQGLFSTSSPTNIANCIRPLKNKVTKEMNVTLTGDSQLKK